MTNQLYENKIFIVTGGAGFIGSHITDVLIERGGKVYIVDNLSKGRKENINPKAEFIQADISKKYSLGYITEQVSCIFHLAATGFIDSFVNVDLAIDTNVKGAENVFEYARKNGVPVVNISSGAVNDPAHPYGLTKQAAEQLASFYSRHFNLPVTTLRYYNVYGPRQICSENVGVIPIFVEQCLNGKPYTIHGDGSQRRIFTYIEDVVQATLLAYEKMPGGTYPVASEQDRSINQVADWVTMIVNPPRKPDCKYLPHKLGDIDRVTVDLSPTKKALGFTAKTTFPQGLRKYVEWRKQKIINQTPAETTVKIPLLGVA